MTMVEQRKSNKVTIHIDLAADVTGFGVAGTVTAAHRVLQKKFSSPWLLGPPASDLLLELICHMFTEDEAEIVQHLPLLRMRDADWTAAKARRPKVEVKAVLDSLAFVKRVILAVGEPRAYAFLPVLPGVFELALVNCDASTLNAWHKRFAELFERLFETGYITAFTRGSKPNIRFIPVQEVRPRLAGAWPTDHLETVFEPFDDFAVGNCQCRLTTRLTGQGCDRALETCTAFGPVARLAVERGLMRKSDRQEILEIKKKAEQEGSITFLGNHIDPKTGDFTCSCCGCCCHALRTITDFNSPGAIAVPHFQPALDRGKCTHCGRCIRVCQVDAWRMLGETLTFSKPRCIGCGLCVTSCKPGALELKPIDEARPPAGTLREMLRQMAPGYLRIGTGIWIKRLLSRPEKRLPGSQGRAPRE